MSANNWEICPKCRENAEKEMRDAYGEISVEEYKELVAKAGNVENFRTFREDYEIGVLGDKFLVSYSGSCERCGLLHEFKHVDHGLSLT